jgi:hypothetical protein
MSKRTYEEGRQSCSLCSYENLSFRKLANHYQATHKTLCCVYCAKWKDTSIQLADHLRTCSAFHHVRKRTKQVRAYIHNNPLVVLGRL